MIYSKRILLVLWVVMLSLLGVQFSAGQDPPDPAPQRQHPAVGSWFGKAVQLCAPGPCPAVALFMTPTLGADGSFIGNDSFALAGPPFGPHTTAHGTWVKTSPTGIIADYVFMVGAAPTTVSAFRFRWKARVTRSNTMTGWVNIYPFPPIPNLWESLTPNQVPTIPPEALPLVTSPTGVVTDPSQCTTQGCPLVFRFKIYRVAP